MCWINTRTHQEFKALIRRIDYRIIGLSPLFSMFEKMKSKTEQSFMPSYSQFIPFHGWFETQRLNLSIIWFAIAQSNTHSLSLSHTHTHTHTHTQTQTHALTNINISIGNGVENKKLPLRFLTEPWFCIWKLSCLDTVYRTFLRENLDSFGKKS